MPFKAFKRNKSTSKPKEMQRDVFHISDAGGNDLGYKGMYLVLMQVLG
jgi:hypothetical protein